MDDLQFRELLNYLNLSWEGYRKVRKGVKKRIRRHMQETACKNISDYIAILDRDNAKKTECDLLMTVSISRFFRDHILWNTLKRDIVPMIIKKESGKINIWSAGCACGEEVYSIRIVLDLFKEEINDLRELKIIATDMKSDYLDRAKAAVYPRSSMKEVPKEFLEKYFEIKRRGKQFAVKPFLKSNIEWKVHHLYSDPPESNFDVIFLRNNILTYCLGNLKQDVFRKIIKSLNPKGFIILGTNETNPLETDELVSFKGYSYIFRYR